MKHSLLFLLVLGLISLGCSGNNKAATKEENSTAPPSTKADQSAGQTSSSPTSTTASANADQKFIEDAIKGNRAEVTLGKMMASKAKDPDVKQFAQMMVKDHTTALSELEQLARQKSVNVPAGLPDDAQELQSKLQSKLQSDSGAQLDKDYMNGMVDDHQKDVQEFQHAAQNATDPDVKQLASKLLPTLQQHLDKAQQVNAKVSGGKS
jgi:putative membrane protein